MQFAVTLLCLLAVGGISAFSPPPPGYRCSGRIQRFCKFYEKDPFCPGNPYVCSVDQKPFECPAIRPECPGLRSQFLAPSICYTDDDCHGFDKCCQDACLDHLTCKGPASGFLDHLAYGK